MISETIQDQFEPPAIGPLELHSKCAALGVLRSEIMSKNVFISGGQFSPYKSVLQGWDILNPNPKTFIFLFVGDRWLWCHIDEVLG